MEPKTGKPSPNTSRAAPKSNASIDGKKSSSPPSSKAPGRPKKIEPSKNTSRCTARASGPRLRMLCPEG
eukprot:CCRYP_008013-RF/>CCRYP_008013-RF protein AED:0.48 eAED:1.00 QI:0/-1/0/1/-1/0/1/0/68